MKEENKMDVSRLEKTSGSSRNILFRVALCSLVLVIGVLGMYTLASLKKPPAEARLEERSIKVEAMTAKSESYPVMVTGYGEARALTVVSVAPEVSGKIVFVYPRLKAGETIKKGDVLFKIDNATYLASRREARAGEKQWLNTIARLKKQYAIDSKRLKTLERNKALAGAEFDRVKNLYAKDRVGTLSGVDKAEQAFNSASDQADLMGQAVTLYPIRIREAESSLESARARLALAKTNLDRCTVYAPFNARIKTAALEKGQYVSPGQGVVTLADDTILEILVPLDSRDARNWLLFEKDNDRSTAWFDRLKPVKSSITWTEDKTHQWFGVLHRVVRFDQQTRTITVAIRIDAASATVSKQNRLPLVEGMFCSVKIPGRTLNAVYRLPRQAVSFDNTVFLADENDRLKTVTVNVARVEGDHVFVAGGISAGNTIITTRLIDPLENALLDIRDLKHKEEKGS